MNGKKINAVVCKHEKQHEILSELVLNLDLSFNEIIVLDQTNSYKKKSNEIVKNEFQFGNVAISYLNFIIENYELMKSYDNCNNWNLFTQAHVTDNCNVAVILNVLRNKISYLHHSESAGFVYIGKNMAMCDIAGSMHHNRTLRTWEIWSELFIEPTPQIYNYSIGHTFLVNNKNITLRTLSFYQKCLEQAKKHEQSNAVFERIWGLIFNTNVV